MTDRRIRRTFACSYPWERLRPCAFVREPIARAAERTRRNKSRLPVRYHSQGSDYLLFRSARTQSPPPWYRAGLTKRDSFPLLQEPRRRLAIDDDGSRCSSLSLPGRYLHAGSSQFCSRSSAISIWRDVKAPQHIAANAVHMCTFPRSVRIEGERRHQPSMIS